MRPPLGGGMPASGAPGPSILGLAGGHNIPPGSQGLQGRVGMQPGMAAGGPQQMRGSWGPVLGGNMGQGSGAGGGMMPPGSPARAMDRAAGQAGASGHESRASGPMQSRGAFLRGVPSGMTSMTNLGRIPVSNVASVAGQRLGSMPASAAFGLRGAPGQQDQQMMMGLQQQHKAGSQPGPMPGAGVLGPPPSSQPQFDHSDFPSLSFDGASASQGGDAPSRSIGLGGDYATMAMQALQDQKRGVVPDFSDTDFPALPGSLGGNR